MTRTYGTHQEISGRALLCKCLTIFFITIDLGECWPPSFDSGVRLESSLRGKTKRSLNEGKGIWESPPMFSKVTEPPVMFLEETEPVDDGDVAVKHWLGLENSLPARVSVKLHSEVMLECTAVGSPPPIITWLKDGKLIESVPYFNWEESLNGLMSAKVQTIASGFAMAKLKTQLPLRCIRPEDEGVYTCIATQTDGVGSTGLRRLSSSTTVSIDEDSENEEPECEFRLPSFHYNGKKSRHGIPAYIHASESHHVEAIGNNIALPCRAGGKPKPRVQWLGNDGVPITPGNKFQINTKGDLVIRNLSWNEMGEYRCIVENSFGSDSTSTFLYPLLPEES